MLFPLLHTISKNDIEIPEFKIETYLEYVYLHGAQICNAINKHVERCVVVSMRCYV